MRTAHLTSPKPALDQLIPNALIMSDADCLAITGNITDMQSQHKSGHCRCERQWIMRLHSVVHTAGSSCTVHGHGQLISPVLFHEP